MWLLENSGLSLPVLSCSEREVAETEEGNQDSRDITEFLSLFLSPCVSINYWLNIDSYLASTYYPCFIDEESIRGRIHIASFILRNLYVPRTTSRCLCGRNWSEILSSVCESSRLSLFCEAELTFCLTFTKCIVIAVQSTFFEFYSCLHSYANLFSGSNIF